MFTRRMGISLLIVIVILLIAGIRPAYRQWNHYQQEQLAARCHQAANQRRWDDVKDLALRWTAMDPSSGEPLMLLGLAASARREWSEAADYFWRVPDTDPHVVNSLIEATKLRFGPLNDPLKGAEALERILRIDPNVAEAHKLLIGFYSTTVQRKKLGRQIQAAIRAQCEPPEAYPFYFLLFTLRDNDALALNERWLKRFPEEETFIVARFLLRPEMSIQDPELSSMSTGSAPEYPQSETESVKREKVDALLARFPQNIELLAYKANLCVVTGDVDGAIAVLSQAPEPARDDARFWRLEGWIHEANQDFDKAQTAYRKALELHAADWNSMIRLTVIERRQKNMSEVKRLTELIDRALKLRRELRKTGKEDAPVPSVLIELAKFYRDCGERLVGPALERRLTGIR